MAKEEPPVTEEMVVTVAMEQAIPVRIYSLGLVIQVMVAMDEIDVNEALVVMESLQRMRKMFMVLVAKVELQDMVEMLE